MGGKVKFVTKLVDFNKEIDNENLTIVDAYATWLVEIVVILR